MSRALQTLVGLASVAQPTAITATQEPSSLWTSLSDYPQPGNAVNFVTTTLLGIQETPVSNPFALIGLNSFVQQVDSQTRTVFYIDYKLRPAYHFDLQNGGINAWRQSSVTIQAAAVTEGEPHILTVSPKDYEALSGSRMDNINDEIPGGIIFTDFFNNHNAMEHSFDPESGTYTFGYKRNTAAAMTDQVVTNEIAGITPYDPENVLAITFSDIFWPFDSRYIGLKYETTVYYNPTLNTLLTGPNGTQTNWIDRVLDATIEAKY